jgi:hypothetical protein
MGFTKLDDGLIFSSILTEDDAVFKVWVLILSRTDSDGVARISSAFLASVCRKTDTEIERCLTVLEGPDKRSRSAQDDGRRIKRIDGGYEVINYLRYRERADREDVRAYERERKRRQRSGVPSLSGTELGRSASASPSASSYGGGLGEPYVPPDVQAENAIRAKRIRSERRLLGVVQAIAEKTNSDPPEVMDKVTSYRRKDGAVVRGRVNPALLSDERLEKSLTDAETWLSDLEKAQ